LDEIMSKSEFNKENTKQLKTMRENFRLLRRSKNWSIEYLSNISGINKKILNEIEDGKDFESIHLIKLCSIYHIKPSEIFLSIPY